MHMQEVDVLAAAAAAQHGATLFWQLLLLLLLLLLSLLNFKLDGQQQHWRLAAAHSLAVTLHLWSRVTVAMEKMLLLCN
jgi:Tfp pilus assembly protein PilX